MLFQLFGFVLYGFASYWKRVLLAAVALVIVVGAITLVRDWTQPEAASGAASTAVSANYVHLANRYGEPIVRQELVDAGLTIPKMESDSLYRIAWVIDGDSLYTSTYEEIRLYGIQAPETKPTASQPSGERCSGEAERELRRLVLEGFLVEGGPRERGPYGRSLYYLYTPAGESIDLHMVVNGFARAFTRDGQHKDVLVEAERLARKHGVGCLWS